MVRGPGLFGLRKISRHFPEQNPARFVAHNPRYFCTQRYLKPVAEPRGLFEARVVLEMQVVYETQVARLPLALHFGPEHHSLK
jgi:hypothetical protein